MEIPETPVPSPSSEGQARPMPCPECQSTKGYNTGGRFKVHCRSCNALVSRNAVDMQLPEESK